MKTNIIKLFLRIAVSIGFLSAVADRLGWWGEEVSTWGNWDRFLEYTRVLNPWLPDAVIPVTGILATAAEVIFGVCLLIGFKTEFIARLSGYLLLIFGLSMTFSTGIKGALDYSVFTASAGAFALSMIKEKFLELDVSIR
ncbi:MAG TPA: hypothetical protein VKN36_07865 [Eudoraea sp.]|nr:hypothetical protein [Eudoraea sp.]